MLPRDRLIHLALQVTLFSIVGTFLAPWKTLGQPCEAVSVNNQGRLGDRNSSGPSVNSNGLFVAYFSDATNLVSDDRNDVRDVFLRNRPGRLTERICVPPEPNGPSQRHGFGPSLSASADLVAYSSDASNLIAADGNGLADVFRCDRRTGERERVSVGVEGAEANGPSTFTDVSADGCCVVFQSLASNLVPDDANESADIFLWSCEAGEIRLVSVASDGSQGNGDSITPAISGDCNVVGFASAAANLVAGDTNRVTDIFVHDLRSGEIERVSVSSTGEEANRTSFFPDLNFDGTVVAYKSEANNLVPNDFNGEPDVFVRDRAADETERVSVDDFGNESDGLSGPPSVDDAGRFVAFPSFGSNLVPDDRNTFADVFVHDRSARRIQRVDCDTEPNGGVPDLPPSLSRDGRWIAFTSSASNLVANDANNALDVFIARVEGAPTPTATGGEKGTATPTPPATETPAGEATETSTATATEEATRTRTSTAAGTATATATQTGAPGTSTATASATETAAATATATSRSASPTPAGLDTDACNCRIGPGSPPRHQVPFAVFPLIVLLLARWLGGRTAKGERTRNGGSTMLSSLLVLMMLASVAQAGEPFLGLDLAASDATNRNFRAHVHGGAAANPYAGYMFNEYFGVQGQLQLIWHRPDNDQRGFEDENQETTWFGAGIGPRLNVPLDITGVCDRFFFCQPDLIDLYFVAQGAHFTGLSGRVSQSAAGFSVGGGLDFKLTRNWAVSANARWSRAYMQPRPQDLGPIQIQNERFGEDIRWATAGVGIKYTFAEPEQAPPPPPPVVAEPEPAPTPRLRRRIVLRAVHFDFDKSNIRPDAVPVLDEAVRILKEESEIVVTVEGHTDWIGTEEYNQGLSERRANAVRNYLVGHGIDPARLRTQGFGELRPVATNETVDGRAQNRRVELRVE